MDRNAEKKIIERVIRGDTEAFTVLVLENQKDAYRLALSITKEAHSAEEAVQDSFVRAFEKLESFKGNSSFRTWLMRIVHNTAVDMVDAKNIMPLPENDNDEAGTKELAAEGPGPEEMFENKLLAESLERAMANLSDEHRRIFELRELMQMSYDEIAEILSIAPGTVRSRLHRARESLRTYLLTNEKASLPEKYAR